MRRDRWSRFFAVWVIELMVLAPLAIAWWISPIGIGFRDWPPGARGDVGRVVYIVGFCTNIVMILAWAGSPLLAAIRGARFALGVVLGLALVQIVLGALTLFVFR